MRFRNNTTFQGFYVNSIGTYFYVKMGGEMVHIVDVNTSLEYNNYNDFITLIYRVINNPVNNLLSDVDNNCRRMV